MNKGFKLTIVSVPVYLDIIGGIQFPENSRWFREVELLFLGVRRV
jgi:hypothetical protein